MTKIGAVFLAVCVIGKVRENCEIPTIEENCELFPTSCE